MGDALAPFVALTLLSAGPLQAPASPPTDSCARLLRLELPQAKVTKAVIVPAGGFVPPAGLTPWLVGDPSFYQALPAFCQVAVLASPSPDSAIAIEVWMPVAGWNGKLRGQGNGGFAGEINFRAMGSAVGQGYATAATDTGHSGIATDASWALGHPEKVIDFGYRAIHVMTEVAKASLEAFYGRRPRRSYFASCSNGGRQALMEVQRFPQDYDGVLAGAPAHHWTHLLTKALADAQATTGEAQSYIPPAKLPAIARAVNLACDATEGVADGIVGDPAKCRFDPKALVCPDGDSVACLTAPQVTALRALYEGPLDARGRRIFPGYPPGAEEGRGGWGLWITGPAPGKSLLFAFALGFFSNMVYEKADWDYRTASIDQALATAEEKTARTLNATDADLSAFAARGGKLILYHGWNDPAISAWSTLEYYDRVMARQGPAATADFLRLYMVPGMQHCEGGPGPSSFGQFGVGPPEAAGNAFVALEEWVERGAAPSALVATRHLDDDPAEEVLVTRPLCPHPQIARYKGQGDPREAASFTCTGASP